MITRKIGKLIRGKATPTQLMLACVLGSMLGFVPGFAQGPGRDNVQETLPIVHHGSIEAMTASVSESAGRVIGSITDRVSDGDRVERGAYGQLDTIRAMGVRWGSDRQHLVCR